MKLLWVVMKLIDVVGVWLCVWNVLDDVYRCCVNLLWLFVLLS